ncbi:MAG: hypothetical protein MJ100_01665 [Ruminococcus sp.]|nr:hypothetical protein [Ruminococcus sp.]
MLSRVIGEFETQELAELAIMRIRESVGSIYSASTIQSKISANANSLTHGTSYTVLPTAFNTRTNFMSAVMESPVYADDVPEPYRRTNTTACIVCGSGSVGEVIAVMNSLGGLNIRSAV